MSNSRTRTPGYRLHRPTGQAVVTFNGRDRYLGRHGTPESKALYNRLLGEWLTNGRGKSAPAAEAAPPPTSAAETTVAEAVLAFWEHAERYYRRRDGGPSQEQENLRVALKPLTRLYGRTPVREFGPLALQAVREEMIRSGLCRTTINARIHRVRRMFRWAASVELIPGSVPEALKTVQSLAEGRSDAPESEGIGPVPAEVVEATLPHLSRPVAALVRLQLLTGCRPSEAMNMRGCDLTPGEPNWVYRPADHKTRWRGKARVIPLGPKAQAVVKEFLKPDLTAFLFDPREAVAERRARSRKSKPTPSELARRSTAAPGKGVADRYERRAYAQAVARACDRAFPHPILSAIKSTRLTPEQRLELAAWRRERRWAPLQLRHASATLLRARYGIEATANVLGHSKPDVTLIYAERDMARAHSVISEIG